MRVKSFVTDHTQHRGSTMILEKNEFKGKTFLTHNLFYFQGQSFEGKTFSLRGFIISDSFQWEQKVSLFKYFELCLILPLSDN